MSGETETEVEENNDEFENAFDEFSNEAPAADVDTDAANLDPGETGADDAAAAATDNNRLSAAEQAAADEAIQADAEKFEGWPQAAIDSYKDQEKKNADLEHRVKSDNGRVGAFQRKINNLEHQIATIQTGPGQPSTADITEAMGTDEGWDKFTEDYPEVAAAIDGRLNTFGNQVSNTLEPVLKRESESLTEKAYGTVAEEFPTWQDAVKTPEFNDWMASQSPGIRALAGSDDTSDASSLIGMYDDFRVNQGDESLRTDPNPDSGISVDETASVADEVAARRDRQLEDGVTIPSKTARVDPNADSGSEFENAFAAFAARKEANRA